MRYQRNLDKFVSYGPSKTSALCSQFSCLFFVLNFHVCLVSVITCTAQLSQVGGWTCTVLDTCIGFGRTLRDISLLHRYVLLFRTRPFYFLFRCEITNSLPCTYRNTPTTFENGHEICVNVFNKRTVSINNYLTFFRWIRWVFFHTLSRTVRATFKLKGRGR